MAMGKNAVHWWGFKIAGKRAAPIRIPCPSLLEIKEKGNTPNKNQRTHDDNDEIQVRKCSQLTLSSHQIVKVSL